MEKQTHEQFIEELTKRINERTEEITEVVSNYVLPPEEYAANVGRIRESKEILELVETVFKIYYSPQD